MLKKILGLLLIFSILFIFSSCGLDYAHSLDENIHNLVERFWNDEANYLIYNGETYIYAGSCTMWRVVNATDDMLISWNGKRWFGYIQEYYSYTNEEPLYIYDLSNSMVYFHEHYDYLFDTFIVEGSDSEIVFNEIFTSEHANVDFVSQHRIMLFSKQTQRIKILVDIAFIDGQWYLRFPDSQEIWIPSDGFITILTDSGII